MSFFIKVVTAVITLLVSEYPLETEMLSFVGKAFPYGLYFLGNCTLSGTEHVLKPFFCGSKLLCDTINGYTVILKDLTYSCRC